MGNGAKAAQKRERNAAASKTAKSQNKVNEAAKSIICSQCKQPFFITTRAPALTDHAGKHNKTMEECFPGVGK